MISIPFLIQQFIGHPIRETVADPCLSNADNKNETGIRYWDDTHLINQLVALRVRINGGLCLSVSMEEEK